tara:strand:- start:530 stop:847 length:318 start_codon:yes stop_codon:yes gene_type:complete
MSWKDILKMDRKTLMVNAIKSEWKSPSYDDPDLSQADVFAAEWVIDNPEKTADALVAMKPAMDYWDELSDRMSNSTDIADSVIERFYMDIKELGKDVEADLERLE